MITEVSPEAHKILKRWARAQCYIWIHPVSSLFVDPDKKPTLYWSVSVEHRGLDWNQWRGAGYDLSEVIEKLGLEIPKFQTKGLVYNPKHVTGTVYAPVTLEKKKKKRAKDR